MRFTAYAATSGVEVDLDAKTLLGAKREASDWITFGGGDVIVSADGEPVAVRYFWRVLDRFGWGPWQTV
jgi:hypothetical protein